MNAIPISHDNQTVLLDLARRSIRHGLSHKRPLEPDLSEYDTKLQEPGATFVTLEIESRLRGCIGTVRAYRPLIVDIAENAWSAAFQDPRFEPLNMKELQVLSIEISLLSKPEPIIFDSEADLKRQINRGLDGLIISDGGYRALFLPTVWDKLPDVRSFLSHLKLKAGMARDYWSDTIEVSRFSTFKFCEHRIGTSGIQSRSG